MISVCLYSDRFFPLVGGAELQALRMARKVRENRKAEFMVVTRRHDPSWPEEEEVEGLKICRLPPAGLGRGPELIFTLGAILFLLRRRKNFEVLHFFLVSFPNALAASVLKLGGKKVLVRIAGAGVLGRGNPLLRPVRNFLLRRMDGFIAVSGEIEREFRRFGFDPGRIHAIPNGVDTEHFRPGEGRGREEGRKKLGLPGEGKIIVYAGRLSEEKGPHLLLQAWLRLAEEFPDSFLVMIGSGEYQERSVEERLDRILAETEAREARRRFFRIGEVADLAPYFQVADVFVLPSRQEGLSNALLEAMAAGLPVVASRLEGIVEALGEDGGVVYVAPGAVEELAEGLREMLEDPVFRRQAGERNRERAVEKYALDKIADQYCQLYGSLSREKDRE